MAVAETPNFDESGASAAQGQPQFTPLSELIRPIAYTGRATGWRSEQEKELIAGVLGLSVTPPKTLVDHVASAKAEYEAAIKDPEELRGFEQGYAAGIRHEKKTLKKRASMLGRLSRVHAEVINVIKEDHGK